MADTVDRKTRSRMMSRIRGRDTRPELALRKSLFRMGFRYRIHVGALPGRPDLVLPKHHAVVFVHGCFWHRHRECKFATMPSSNVEFWQQKFARTIERDARTVDELRRTGWRVTVAWECALAKSDKAHVAKAIGTWLMSKKAFLEIPVSAGPCSRE